MGFMHADLMEIEMHGAFAGASSGLVNSCFVVIKIVIVSRASAMPRSTAQFLTAFQLWSQI
jgi:hypothetical protein